MVEYDCTRSRLRLEYLNKDKPGEAGVKLANLASLSLSVGGSQIYGAVMIPDGSYQAPRPCVIMIHGIPGTARNDDLAQALRRCGCVVIVPHHRGAWGSQGKYLVSHCVEDAAALSEYARSEAFCREMNVDPDNIFLCGHSMGGNTVLQTARKLPWIRGVVMLTPYNPARYLLTGREERLYRLLEEESRILQTDGVKALYEDVKAHRDEYDFASAYEDMKDRNICMAVGSEDEVAPGDEMALPLWNQLKQHETKAVQRYKVFDCDHCLDNVRFALAEFVGTFIKESLKEN